MDKEGPTASDHVIIWASWESLEEEDEPGGVMIMGWQIDLLLEDEEAFSAIKRTWGGLRGTRPPLMDECSLGDVEDEADWVERTLTDVLNEHAKLIKLCARSKCWWGPQTVDARSAYSKTYRAYQAGDISEKDLQEAWKTYYTAIRRAKRECWEAFLQGTNEGSLPEQKRCWAALRYAKSTASGTTPALIDPVTKDVIAATFKEKETIFRGQAFP